MGRKFGFSWSWRRASGLSALKGRISRKIGVPLTKSGRERKLGRLLLGGFIPVGGGTRSSRGRSAAAAKVIAVCPHCGHENQIRETTVGAIKKCVACGEKFRPQFPPEDAPKQVSSGCGCLIVLLATFGMIGFGVWRTQQPSSIPPHSGPADTPRARPSHSNSNEAATRATTPDTVPAPAQGRATSPVAPVPAKTSTSTRPSATVPVVGQRTLAERRQAALDALYRRPDYIAAKKRADDLEQKLNAARADPKRPNLQALSQQWLNAKSALRRMEAEATRDLR